MCLCRKNHRLELSWTVPRESGNRRFRFVAECGHIEIKALINVFADDTQWVAMPQFIVLADYPIS